METNFDQLNEWIICLSRKKSYQIILSLLLLVLVQWPCLGSNTGIGARAMALGGAFTAVADDGTASYWNPAGLNLLKIGTFTPSASGTYDISKIFGLLDDDLSKTEYEKDFQLHSHGMIGFSSKSISFSVYREISGDNKRNTPSADFFARADQYAVVSLAGKIQDTFLIGINFKSYYGNSVNFNYQPYNSLPIIKTKERTIGNGMAYDLGIIMKPIDQLSVGLMLRNCDSKIRWTQKTSQYHDNYDNSIQSSVPTVLKYNSHLQKNTVFGLAYYPLRSLQLTFDYELNSKHELNYNQSYIRFGIEKNLLFNSIILRAGGFKREHEDFVFTSGLGLKLGPTVLDLAISDPQKPELFITINYKF